MKVLFVSAWWPFPPDNGSRIRVFNLMKALSVRHEVYLVSLLQEDSDPTRSQAFPGVCEVVCTQKERVPARGSLKSFTALLSTRPRDYLLMFDPAMKRAVANCVREISPDVVVVSTLGVAEYAPFSAGVPMLLEQHNCEFALLRRGAPRGVGRLPRLRHALMCRKNELWETGVCRKFDAVTLVSEDDKRHLSRAAPDLRKLFVVPNGVDTEQFDPGLWSPDGGALLYSGALTYGANLDAVRYFAAEIMPILRQERRDVVLRVTGRTTGVDLSGISGNDNVLLTGYVDDIRPILAKSAVCVVPLREGGGTRLKILEAMAAGVPVVSTSVGAEGIEAIDGRHFLLADTPAAFAEAVIRILREPGLASSLRAEARRLVEDKYRWNVIGERFAEIVERTYGIRQAATSGGGE